MGWQMPHSELDHSGTVTVVETRCAECGELLSHVVTPPSSDQLPEGGPAIVLGLAPLGKHVKTRQLSDEEKDTLCSDSRYPPLPPLMTPLRNDIDELVKPTSATNDSLPGTEVTDEQRSRRLEHEMSMEHQVEQARQIRPRGGDVLTTTAVERLRLVCEAAAVWLPKTTDGGLSAALVEVYSGDLGTALMHDGSPQAIAFLADLNFVLDRW